MKAVPEHKFHQMIKERGCSWSTTASNEYAIWYEGKIVSRYGVWHSKGSKREVGMVYVKRFIRLFDEIKSVEGVKGDSSC